MSREANGDAERGARATTQIHTGGVERGPERFATHRGKTIKTPEL